MMEKNYLNLKLVFIIIVFPYYLFSTPDLALWTGNRCSKCHINPQGGGLRTDFGWKFLRDASHFPIGNEEIKKIYQLFDKEKHAFDVEIQDKKDTLHFENSFSFGFDFRFQSTRSHRTELAKRKYYPMEANFYLGFKPSEMLSVNGQYNLGKIVFQGQDNWTASINLNLSEILPSIQIGKFQPSFGIRDCDMTIFDRRIASIDYTVSLFPPDYSEFGIELSYRKFELFEVFLGAFDSRYLSQVTIFGDQPIVVKHNPTFNSKLIFYPPLDDMPIVYSFLGSSALINGNFLYSSSFLGFLIFERLSLFIEYAHSRLKDLRTTNNVILKIHYFPYRGIIPYGRFEVGTTKLSITPQNVWTLKNTSALIGIKYFPIPYLEANVEYRYFSGEENRSTRWAFQIHIYY
ncbi:MAG: hypothetical protein N2517_05430 [Ignavibacteria bacterium]|nr:hypothetical protein [Ignavibacteria bacterium]